MPASYVRVWLSMEAAIDHVKGIAGSSRQEARDVLVQAILDGEIRSRFGDNGLQEIKAFLWQHARQWAPYSGFGARIPNRVRINGEAAYLRPYFDPPPDPSLLPERMRLVEVRREDVERLWRLELALQDAPPGRPAPAFAGASDVGAYGGTTATPNRVPDWDWWRHVSTVSLHEAVALSLNIDPKQLRRAALAERQSEGPEFERRLALASRCLGDTLPGPINYPAVRYFDEAPAIRLREFLAWANSVEWQIPPELTRLAAGVFKRAGNTQDPDSNERLSLPEQVRLLARTMPEEQAQARIDKAFRFQEITYQPHYGVPYNDTRIDWGTGEVILSRLPRQKFTPTLTAAKFFAHFMPSPAPAASAEPQAITIEPDIAKPEGEPAPPAGNDAVTHSGFPGRPSKARHLIDDEFQRRMKTGETLASASDEAAALLAWLVKAHPTVPRPTRKTIENNIRIDHRRWKANRGV